MISVSVPKATPPAEMLNVGVAWAFVIVYAALPIALFTHPVFIAIAFIVIASFMVTVPVYKVLDVVGVEPFVV